MRGIRTYQTASDEEDRDRDMFQVLSAERVICATEMLEEDICRAVRKDERTLHKLSGRPPFMRAPLGTNIPRLHPLLAP